MILLYVEECHYKVRKIEVDKADGAIASYSSALLVDS